MPRAEMNVDSRILRNRECTYSRRRSDRPGGRQFSTRARHKSRIASLRKVELRDRGIQFNQLFRDEFHLCRSQVFLACPADTETRDRRPDRLILRTLRRDKPAVAETLGSLMVLCSIAFGITLFCARGFDITAARYSSPKRQGRSSRLQSPLQEAKRRRPSMR